jgi:DNA-binding NtrC family response regulator
MPEFERTLIREALKVDPWRPPRTQRSCSAGGRNTLTRKLKELGMDDA